MFGVYLVFLRTIGYILKSNPMDRDTWMISAEGGLMNALDIYGRDLGQCETMSAQAEASASADALVCANLRFAYRIATEYRGRGVDLEDLVQAANLGLCRAARRFDPARGFRFITFAVHHIRAACLAAVRDCEAVRISRYYTDAGGSVAVESLDTPLPGGEVPLDLLPDDAPLPDDVAEAESTRQAVARAFEGLSEREKTILRLHFGLDGDAHTLQATGQQIGLTKERVRQIRNRALGRLRHIEELRECA